MSKNIRRKQDEDENLTAAVAVATMATPPDSPIEEEVVLFELEPKARTPKPIPVALEDLCRLTKFTRQEIRVMYRGFKTVSKPSSLTHTPFLFLSLSFTHHFFPHLSILLLENSLVFFHILFPHPTTMFVVIFFLIFGFRH